MLFDFLSSKPECLDLRSYLLKKYLSLPYDVYVFATDSCSNSILQIGDFLGFVITFFTGYSPFHFSGDFSEYLKCDLKSFDTGSQTFFTSNTNWLESKGTWRYTCYYCSSFLTVCLLVTYFLLLTGWKNRSLE